MYRSVDGSDKGRKIVKFALDRVRLGVATLTAATPVNGVHGEVPFEVGKDGSPV
jgi:hypothetical protein